MGVDSAGVSLRRLVQLFVCFLSLFYFYFFQSRNAAKSLCLSDFSLAPNLINLESKEAHWPNRMDRAIH
jgi:hypothetical protein